MTNWAGATEKHVFIFSTCLSWCRFEAAGVLVAHVLLPKLIWKCDSFIFFVSFFWSSVPPKDGGSLITQFLFFCWL